MVKMTTSSFPLINRGHLFSRLILESESPMELASANEKLATIRGRSRRGSKNAFPEKLLAFLGV